MRGSPLDGGRAREPDRRGAVNLDAELRTLAAELREEIPAMVEHGLEQMRRELPEFFVRDDDPDFVDVYRQSFRAQLRFIYDGLESGRDVEGVEAPPLALEEARMAAARGIELGNDPAGLPRHPPADPRRGTRARARPGRAAGHVALVVHLHGLDDAARERGLSPRTRPARARPRATDAPARARRARRRADRRRADARTRSSSRISGWWPGGRRPSGRWPMPPRRRGWRC